jgi:CRISPR/Cas system CSM-associated protein Csm3 (group 7 of RAMP superfamily)
MSASSKPHPGYDFIPIPDRVDRPSRPQAHHGRHDNGCLTGTLALTWLAEQPIHVGSGFKTLVGEKRDIVRQTVRLGDIPCIPGSTLKGVLRARHAAITYSCIAAPRSAEKTKIRSSTYKDAQARISTTAVRSEPFLPMNACMCPTCALFGRLDLRSRLVITDALPDSLDISREKKMPAQFSPNLHHIGVFVLNRNANVLEIQKLHGRKFATGQDDRPPPDGYRNKVVMQTVEAIPQGSCLRSEIRFLNLTPAELGGVCAALGRAPESRLKVGGGKSHGFGRLRLKELVPTLRRPNTALDLPRIERAFRSDPACNENSLMKLVELHGEQC